MQQGLAKQYGPLPKDKDAFTARCRLLQSWYRVEMLGQECGPWRRGAQPVGSSLVDGESTGANFISETAFEYAKQRVADKAENHDLTIEEFRLFNNMLSSQPMCFNLFAEFRAAVQETRPDATKVLAAIFSSSLIKSVTDVIVEMIPTPTKNYINDKTAFDAAIFYTDPNGQPGLASIETKYTDKLGKNPASKPDVQFELVRRLGVFTADALAHYEERGGFDQIVRNLLLTIAYAEKHGLATAANYVLAPSADVETPERIAELQSRLTEPYRDKIEWLPLEQVVERGQTADALWAADHLKQFYRRYLDFTPIDSLSQ
jgi:hypothetical protein